MAQRSNDIEVGPLQQLTATDRVIDSSTFFANDRARADAARALNTDDVSASFTETVRIQRPLRVAIITAIQAVTPTIVAVSCLLALGFLYGTPLDLRAPAVLLMVVLCLVLVHIPAQVGTQLAAPRTEAALRMLGRWALLVMMLSALAMLTGFMDDLAPLKQIALVWAIATPAVLVAVSIVMHEITRRPLLTATQVRRAAFVGYNDNSRALASRLGADARFNIRPAGFFDDRSDSRLGLLDGDLLLGTLPDLPAYVKRNRVDLIFISLPIGHIKRVVDLVDKLHDTTASIYYVPDVYVFDLIQARSSQIGGIPVVALLESPFSGYDGVTKRLTDLALSTFLLAALAPVLLAIAALVMITSPGPAVFRQRRYGLDGREIVVYKFRSMRVTEDGDQIRQASREDDRITPVGAFLRRTSLDELPQLLNVLQGKMSLVGPRPHAVAHNEQYRKLIKGYMLRHKVLPGITGLAQVNGCRGETARLEDMQARITYDLDYLRHWSPLLDLKILALTAIRLLGDRKAY